VALIGSGAGDGLRASPTGPAARIRHWLTDRGDTSLAQRVASTAFLIRITAAILAFGSQVLLARWMGGHEFGVFVYVSTWVMVIGGIADLGLASSAQRFIPQYSEKGAFALLRGFLFASRWLGFAIAVVAALAGLAALFVFRNWLDDQTLIPLAIACVILPVYSLMHVQDGIARSYNWPNLALMPPFVFRQLMVIALMGAAYAFGLTTDATAGIAIAAISIWVCAIAQFLILNRKLKVKVPAGPKSYNIGHWIAVSLPMFLIDSIYVLLMYVDVLILKQFRPPEEIALYFAAAKTMALVSFVYFAVSAASAHRFSEYHQAGNRAQLAAFLRDAVRWTFWPSLGATLIVLACGWPLLRLFGERFVEGYPLMYVLAIGVLARAAIGPGERFLCMLGEQRSCAIAALLALIVNLALCFALIPIHGVMGAAMATSIAFIVESLGIYAIARYRLGYHLFVLGGRPH
jgi:O-antigen/teichoic acid export membrane protein